MWGLYSVWRSVYCALRFGGVGIKVLVDLDAATRPNDKLSRVYGGCGSCGMGTSLVLSGNSVAV